MKRFLLFTFLAFVAVLPTLAQTSARSTALMQSIAQKDSSVVAPRAPFRFGYLSCDSAIHAMPDYVVARKNLEVLRSKYDAEMKRVEDEFNEKYELFLEGQRDFAPSILQKRQAELQELMEKNQAFKEEAKRLLAEAEKEAMAPIKAKVNAAIRQIGRTRGLAFIINTDSNALPYTDVVMGEDITQAVIRVAK